MSSWSKWDESVARARALAAEATSLSGVDRGPLEVGWLASAAGWLAEAAPRWEEMAGQVPTGRSYRRLFSARSLEAWLICWPAGGHLQLHDHGGASGAFAVIAGALDERCLQGRRSPDGGLTAVDVEWRDRTVGPGRTVAFDGRYIHDVRHAPGPVTTSVHVYGAAVRPMAFYRVDGGLLRTVELGEERSLIEAEVAAEGRSLGMSGDDAVTPSWRGRRRASRSAGPADPDRQAVPG